MLTGLNFETQGLHEVTGLSAGSCARQHAAPQLTAGYQLAPASELIGDTVRIARLTDIRREQVEQSASACPFRQSKRFTPCGATLLFWHVRECEFQGRPRCLEIQVLDAEVCCKRRLQLVTT